jgi:predicted transcriptional regulator
MGIWPAVPGGLFMAPKAPKVAVDIVSGLAKFLCAMPNQPAVAKFKSQARVFKALGHAGRLLMLDELSRGERCVCELAALVGSEMPTVSRHLAQLRNAGIVDDEKRGAQVFYRLVTPCVMNFFECVASVRGNTRA